MPPHAKFRANWTITRPEFENIQRKKITKIVLPSYKNVVFRFRVELGGPMEVNVEQKLGMNIFYEDGPLCELDYFSLRCQLRKGTEILDFYRQWQPVKRGEGGHLFNFENKDIDEFTSKNDWDIMDDVQYSIRISLWLTSFDYEMPKPEIEQCRHLGWHTGLFQYLDDVEKSDFSDVRFVAVDGGTFYCHRNIIGEQSKELKTMLKNPKSDGEKSGSFCFPSLDTSSLIAILKYLYTAECDQLIELPVPLIIQVADFSEQYGLKILKEASISQLWKMVVECPQDAIEILRFADLHDEAKYLKDRAMSVIIENFDKFSLQMRDFSGENNNHSQGYRLIQEFMLYTLRRVSIDP